MRRVIEIASLVLTCLLLIVDPGSIQVSMEAHADAGHCLGQYCAERKQAGYHGQPWVRLEQRGRSQLIVSSVAGAL